jgi:DNA (cytosine-5)-methyltransferase 1
MLVHRGLERVIGDLTALGYDTRWTVMGASDVGAPHRRDRFWLVAHANGMRELQPQRIEQDERRRTGNGRDEENISDAMHLRLEGFVKAGAAPRTVDRSSYGSDPGWWRSEPDVGRVADGVAARVDRLKAIGNGQVPAVAAAAWNYLNSKK